MTRWQTENGTINGNITFMSPVQDFHGKKEITKPQIDLKIQKQHRTSHILYSIIYSEFHGRYQISSNELTSNGLKSLVKKIFQ